MKKRLLILFLFIFCVNIYPQEENTSAIYEFSAKLKKGNIFLKWVIKNLPQLSKIRFEVKYPDENLYQLVDDISIDHFAKKIIIDSTEYHQYNYTFKPIRNGVYFFRINLMDNSLNIKNTDEIKIGVSDIIEFKLHQNTPNPFNPSTNISYELYTATKVTLKIYSLNGKEIETLIDEYQNPGTYKFEFNATKYTELSSGIYFYKLQTDHSSDIKKMIFTK